MSPPLSSFTGPGTTTRLGTGVVPILNAQGFATETLDLPSAGVNARAPASFRRRPFDVAAFASEPSPNAGVTQEERTEAVIRVVEATAAGGNGKVVLVGHSAGGLTVSDVAEHIPEKLHALVYIAAQLWPNGVPAMAMARHETMAASTVPGLLMANPAEVGALRINVASDDPAYVAAMRETLYGDGLRRQAWQEPTIVILK